MADKQHTVAEAGSRTGALRAFRNRNYTLFFCGQSLSQIGTWMQRTAVSWVVYSFTHSALTLGVLVFAQQFPSFLLSLVGGIFADRYRRYTILLVTQAASLLQAVALALVVRTGHYALWPLLALSVVLGTINAFDMPARQPMVHELLDDPADLPSALALNSAMVNVARFVGPALAGFCLTAFGADTCFLLNAGSFVAVLLSLLLLRLPAPAPVVASRLSVGRQLAEGLAYVRATPPIRTALLLLATMSLLVLPYDTLLPVVARQVFRGDAATFGYIDSFGGLGAIGGAALLAGLRPAANRQRILLASILVLGVALLGFSRLRLFAPAMPFVVLAGFGTMAQTTLAITIVQTEAAAPMRGRVMSYVVMSYFGMMPLGSLLIGYVAQHLGAPTALLLQGAAALLLAAAFAKVLSTK